MINTKYLDEDLYDKEVSIDNSSTYHLSECLKNHAKIEGRYQRHLSDAIKELDTATYEFEILTAEIADEIIRKAEESGNPIPASGKEYVMKGGVKLDPRWRKARKKVIEAKYIVAILKGYTRGMEGRGFRLNEICKLEEKKMRGDLSYKDSEVEYGQSKADKFKSVDRRVEDAGEQLDFGE